MSAREVPVVAVTGYLGAGKTTLLNHLLRRPGARLGVVVNDFGQVNVDAMLVTGQVDDAVSVAGGCLCCMPADEGLDVALQKLARPDLRLDAVIVEASGVADPATLAHLIRISGVHGMCPGGIVEVVDSPRYFDTVDTGVLAPARFVAASLVVLNKIDEIPEAERELTERRIEARVRERTRAARIVAAFRGEVDPDLVFDTASSEHPLDQLPLWELIDEPEDERSTNLDGEEHGGHAHVHADSVTVRLHEPVEAGALVNLLENPPSDAYRIKGRVPVAGKRGTMGVLVNIVGAGVHVTRRRLPEGEGELVAIGVGMDTDAVRQRLEAGLAPAQCPSSPEGLKRLRDHLRLGR